MGDNSDLLPFPPQDIQGACCPGSKQKLYHSLGEDQFLNVVFLFLFHPQVLLSGVWWWIFHGVLTEPAHILPFWDNYPGGSLLF